MCKHSLPTHLRHVRVSNGFCQHFSTFEKNTLRKVLTMMDLTLLKSKFRGSMLGVLVGDCVGSAFEFEEMTAGFKLVIQQCFDKLEGPVFKAPVRKFSDDAAMSYSLATSLIENKKLDEVDLAKKFVSSFYKEPGRGYGAGVVTVFEKLRGSKFKDVYAPAQKQFKGFGSWGNGAAMRVAPAALFCYNDFNNLIDVSRRQSLITHTHKLGVDGAILQALAVHQALHLNPETPLNTTKFLNELIEKMKSVEVDDEDLGLSEPEPYRKQLNMVKELLNAEELPNDEKVIKELGNGSDISAIHSVPTSIFCFLRGVNPIPGINTENPLRRGIQYAITLGGDADTIASMTGAIGGAFYGEEMFSPNLLSHCEAMNEFRKVGDELADIVFSENK